MNPLNYLGTFSSADDVLAATCKHLLRAGCSIAPRGMRTIEASALAFVLKSPRARRIENPARHWSEALAVGELSWHLSASDDVKFISYYAKEWARFSEDGTHIAGSCYGKRIFGPGPEKGAPSQWELVRGELRRDAESRRAVLTLTDTSRDLRPSSKDVPCLISVQFLLRAGKLDCIATMRSNDVIWGLCYDLYLVTMLQELLACELGVGLGSYTHVAASMHVYDQFIPMAEEIAASRSGVEGRAMPPMTEVGSRTAFLEVERALRMNQSGYERKMAALPTYWRTLAEPLRLLHERRHQATLVS